MGTEEVTSNASTELPPPPPQAPPPEEPPKLEEIVTPEVLSAIVQGYKPELSLVEFQAQPGSKVGDNYMSIMYALEILLENKTTGDTERLDVMLKTIPRNIYRAEMINEMKVFEKESLVYRDVFPILVETQKERQLPASEHFAAWPICYAAHVDGATDYLAMENLKVANYKMGNRATGVDFNHCALVLRNLAKFHAISYAKFGGSQEAIMKAFPILSHGMFVKDSKVGEMQQQFMSQGFRTQAESLRKLGDDLCATRMEKLAASDFNTLLNDLVTKNVEHAIITHGDCWVNNMLFKYDDKDDTGCGVPTGVKFLDFQLSQASSRLVDIHYFLLTSAKPDVILEREEDLLLSYYTAFTCAAQKLGIDTKAKGLTWQNFVKESDKYRFYGVFLGLLLAPMLSADAADIPDMETMTEEEFKVGEDSMEKFFKEMDKGQSIKKVQMIVSKFLPRCSEAVHFL